MASRRKGRVLAFQALYSWELVYRQTGVNTVPEGLLDFPWLENDKKAAINVETLAFSRLLISGTVENIAAIDEMIRGHLENWDISRLKKVDLAILRMSTYSLMFQEEIAPSIVISEAIGICRDYGAEDSFRFVNGVLDSIHRSLAGQGHDKPA